MGISGISSINSSMPVMQRNPADLKDHKSKNIQNEITQVQQQLQKLSSEDELSASEKADEKKKLQKEKSSLDTKLKQHQEELLRSQKREIKLAELQEERTPAETEDSEGEASAATASTDTTDRENASIGEQQQAQSLQPGTIIAQNSDGTVILKEVAPPAESSTAAAQTASADKAKEDSADAKAAAEEEEKETTDPTAEFRPTAQEMQAMVSADTSMQQADRMGTLVTKTEDGIAILKGEIKQDAYRGTDTDRKQAELNAMQKQREREMGVQFALLGAADESGKDRIPEDAEKNFQVSGLNVPQDEQAAQERFHVAIA